MSVNHCGSTFSGTDVIDMGTSGCTGCSGITIEHLKVDGNGLLVNGIRNYSGDPSYVSDVNFSNIGMPSGSGGSATALIVDANAAGSGPYTNLNLTSGGICGTGGCGACVSIQAPTRGLHGITCSSVGVGAAAKAAIYVNANNNSVEDVHIEVFTDGIQIGTPSGTTPVSNVVVSNVTGANVVNVVHVCGTKYGSASCGNTTAPNDVALLHISNGSTAGADAVLDDVTGTVVGVIPAGGASSTVGMYLLGTSVVDSNGEVAVPRFTTAPGIFGTSGGGVPTWAVGSMAPSGSSCGLTGANGAGSLYSNTTGKFGSKNTLFICIGGSWKAVSDL
jgi:hypothetical protein